MQHGCSVRPVAAARSAGKGKAKKGKVELIARKRHAHDCATYADRLSTLRVARAPHGGRGGRDTVWIRALTAPSECGTLRGCKRLPQVRGHGWPDDAARQRVPARPPGAGPDGSASACRLLAAGCDVAVPHRSRAKAERRRQRGPGMSAQPRTWANPYVTSHDAGRRSGEMRL